MKLCFTSSRALAALYQSDFVCRKNRIEQLGKSLLQLIYVKKPERVAVLGDLFFLVLAIYRVFQRRVRPFITPERPLQGVGGRKWTRPTGQTIFQLFWYVRVVLLERPDGQIQHRLGKPLTPDQRRILQGLGMDESIYV